MNTPDGNAIVYCQGAYGTTNGKTAHGLVRRTSRYRVLSVVDERHAGGDAGDILDGKPSGIPIYPSVLDAIEAGAYATVREAQPTHLVVGLAPDGGRLPPAARAEIELALRRRLHVDSGLHDFLSEDPVLAAVASENGVRIRDVRKPLERKDLHFFSGKIEEVDCCKLALLGTDSAVGKRTTAWLLIDAMAARGYRAEMVGTGQTAWLQGARFSIVEDSLVSDFMAGEIEHAVWSAWHETRPDLIVIEGQGSLMNPAYPGGYEILAAGRPDFVVMQHAPARLEYDGFPGYPLHPLAHQIEAVELVSGKPVIGVTLNHENLTDSELERARLEIAQETGLPVCAPLRTGLDSLVDALASLLDARKDQVIPDDTETAAGA